MQQTPTAIDLKSLGYPVCHVKPLDGKLFEVSPVIHGSFEIWSSSRMGFTANDMYQEMSNVDVISDAVGLPTLTHYFNSQQDIPESWIGRRVFGLKGIVVHHDGDSVAPYLDCRYIGSDDESTAQVYIGFFRLKGRLSEDDAFIVLQR
jgi:hypothetical protein